MQPEVEQELAHILLIELLAHQFTFPVRWIETQDVLLMDQGVERLIEVGPAPTLTNMAKRTMENLYDGIDPLLKDRQFLSCVKDADKVYYRAESVIEEPVFIQPIPSVPFVASMAPQSIPQVIPAIPTSVIPDTELSVGYVLRTIVATKLKKPISEIELSATIKKLAGGRSTMENEIVGDLLAEFKNLPDRPEEQAISELCQVLESCYNKRFGSYTSSQIAKLFQSRMPGGYSLDTAREYLKSTWNLQGGRQDMVLLSTIAAPPASRLKTYEVAEAFLDELVNKHALENCITISKGTQIASAPQAASIDPTVFNGIDKARRELSKKKLQAYAQDLNVDLRAGEKKASATQIALDQALEELDLWNAEHGSTYASGIKPMLQTSKGRHYKSWENWAQQDVTVLFNQIQTGEIECDDSNLAKRLLHISNCATPKIVQQLESFNKLAKTPTTPEKTDAATILDSLTTMCQRLTSEAPVFRSTHEDLMPITSISRMGEIVVEEVLRPSTTKEHVLTLGKPGILPVVQRAAPSTYPSVALKTQGEVGWKNDQRMSSDYIRVIHKLKDSGITFHGKNVLVTGAGAGSIGAEVLKGLLAGGAKVICTTSKYSASAADAFREIYATHGGRGSELIVLPFNQASHQDVESLISYIYSTSGLNCDLDIVLPFAAIPEADRDIDQIDAKSELAHRAMLTNTVRLIGAIKRNKHSRGIDTRPAQVLLPLSSNHGIIGKDGLYAETKLALEGLMHKWHSEEWSSYLSLCGVEIGWTRGTGLMHGNDVVAQGIEKLGVRTFSREEMAANILALCSPSVARFCEEGPVMADLNGGLNKVKNLAAHLKRIRGDIQERKINFRAIYDEKKHDADCIHEDTAFDSQESTQKSSTTVKAADLSTLPEIDYETQVEPLVAGLQGMIDLDRVAVITGFAELGPFGSARTRMEMELGNGFSDAGCVELAVIMSLIKKSASSTNAASWVDCTTGESVQEADVKARYEEKILGNTGIRLVNSEANEQQMIQEIVLQEDMAPVTTTAQGAIEYARIHGRNAEIWQESGPDDWRVVLKSGATIMIPKAVSSLTAAVGQLPAGWNPATYGIEESIISQVDRITLYTLVAVVEALLVSGIPDFYSLYKHIHPSEVVNCIGSGQGGMSSLRSLFRDRYTDQPVQNDILQETFANTTGAWINMLLLGASGPIRTPVGACATALESLDSAAELIHAGKARLALVGGADDWSREVGAEFRNMRATVDPAAEAVSGREPNEFSRPMATTRAGFVEAQGAGIQVVTSARLALDLGLPIHGIIAFTGLASDKPGRSVPAPGKGLLNFAAAAEKSEFPDPMLNLSYRRRVLERRMAQIENARLAEVEDLAFEAESIPESQRASYMASRSQQISSTASSSQSSLRRDLSHTLSTRPTISPLAASLATWGLSADSISVLCLHGTSTSKGDSNEANVLNTQLSHLGRSNSTPPAIAVCSKSLTGHAKGAAGAWSLNTALQILATGAVPRNRNLDDLSPELSQLEHISFLGGSGPGVKLAHGVDVISVSAFGFGQKGAQVLVVHPRFLFASLDGGKDEFEVYWGKMRRRRMVARREMGDGLWKGDLVGKRIVREGVWEGNREEEVLLDRGWRA